VAHALETVPASINARKATSVARFIETSIPEIGSREGGLSRSDLFESVFAELTVADLRLILLSSTAKRNGATSPPLSQVELDVSDQSDGLAHDVALEIAWDDLG
jgi:hypothetical protein